MKLTKSKLWLMTLVPVVTSILTLAPVVSCATTNDQPNQDLETIKNLPEKAWSQSLLNLQANFSRFNLDYADEAKVVKLNNYVLNPKNNFGFSSKLSAISADETKDGNRQTGIKRVQLTVTRSDYPSYSQTVDLGGFITDLQYQAERDDPELLTSKQLKWVPSHPIKMKTKQPHLNVRNALKQLQASGVDGLDALATLVNVAGDGVEIDPNQPNPTYSQSLLVNQTLAKDVKLVIANSQQVLIDGFATDQIKVIFQLIKGQKKSRYVELIIDGFNHDQAQDNLTNLNRYIQIWQTWLNPLRVTAGLVLPQPSLINNVQNLQKWLSPGWNQFQNIITTIDDIESADDQLGILKVKATFKYQDQPVSSAKTTVINIYGFTQAKGNN